MLIVQRTQHKTMLESRSSDQTIQEADPEAEMKLTIPLQRHARSRF